MKKLILLIIVLFTSYLYSADNNFVQIKSISNLQNSIDLKIKPPTGEKLLIFMRKKSSPISIPQKDNKDLNMKEVLVPMNLEKPSQIFYAKTALDLKVVNLTPETEYFLDVFQGNEPEKCKLVKSIDFNTLAFEPPKQSSALSFMNTSHNAISLLWKSGDGQNTIIVCKKGSKPDLPVDGTEYQASPNFGDQTSKLGNSFVVFNGKFDKTKEVRIKNLEFADYYFAVFEYNGKGKYCNYNTKIEKSNARNKHTLLPPPVAKNLVMKDGTIQASWSKIDLADNYVVELAYDEHFTKYVESYNGADVGKITEIEMVLPEKDPARVVYFRVKAQDKKTLSQPSNVLKLEIGK